MSLISSELKRMCPRSPSPPKQFSTSASTVFSFPRRSSSSSTRLILYTPSPPSQPEVCAFFSMTSNKGQSLVWIRRVLGDETPSPSQSTRWANLGERNKTKRGTSKCKNSPFDNLLLFFSLWRLRTLGGRTDNCPYGARIAQNA